MLKGPMPGQAGQIEAALAKLEAAQDSLLGFGHLSESLFQFTNTDGQEGGSGGQALTGAAMCPGMAWGVKALQGQRPNMEDAYSVQMQQFGPPSAPAAVPDDASHAACSSSADASGGPSSDSGTPAAATIPEDLAVLSVFDGHGGTEVATHCRDRLHKHFATSLSCQQRCCSSLEEEAGGGACERGASADGEAPAAAALGCNSNSTCDDAEGLGVALSDSATTLPAPRTCGDGYTPNHVTEALRAAFYRTDQELAGTETGEFVGATAVVAVIGRQHIWIAHCGDSRAVIQRAGDAEALTRDHKPERDDEAARIKAAGGRVVFTSGSHRVMGMLAMSRAIGDHFLRPYVIAEPEVACVERTPQDEVLVLATDGLWDVFTSKEATTLAQRCISRSKERGMSRHGACRVAASVLTKVALERGSRDNITVIVVDVSYPQPPPQQQPQGTSPSVHSPQHPQASQPAQPSRLRGQLSDTDAAAQSHGRAAGAAATGMASRQSAQQHALTSSPSDDGPCAHSVPAEATEHHPASGPAGPAGTAQASPTGAAGGMALPPLPAPGQGPATGGGALAREGSEGNLTGSRLGPQGRKPASEAGALRPAEGVVMEGPAVVKAVPSSSADSKAAGLLAAAGGAAKPQASVSAGAKDGAGARGPVTPPSTVGCRTPSFSVSSCTWLKGNSGQHPSSSMSQIPVIQAPKGEATDPSRVINRQLSAPQGHPMQAQQQQQQQQGDASSSQPQAGPQAHGTAPVEGDTGAQSGQGMMSSAEDPNSGATGMGAMPKASSAADVAQQGPGGSGLPPQPPSLSSTPQHSSMPNLAAMCSGGGADTAHAGPPVQGSISNTLSAGHAAGTQVPQPHTQQQRPSLPTLSVPLPPAAGASTSSGSSGGGKGVRFTNGAADGHTTASKQPLSPPARSTVSENGGPIRHRVTVRRPPSAAKLDAAGLGEASPTAAATAAATGAAAPKGVKGADAGLPLPPQHVQVSGSTASAGGGALASPTVAAQQQASRAL